MNAVEHMARQLPPEAVRRMAALRVQRFAAPVPMQLIDTAIARERVVLDVDQACERVRDRWAGDLCGFLNVMTHGELGQLALALGLEDAGRSAELRDRLWQAGARFERGDDDVSDHVQPRPIVLGGHLVVQAAPRGMFPPRTIGRGCTWSDTS